MSLGFVDSAQLVHEDFRDVEFIHLSDGSVFCLEVMDDPELMLSGYEPEEDIAWLH